MRGVRLYCGVSETRWNHHPVACGDYACVSPVQGASIRTKRSNRVAIPDGTLVLQDSGAFQDSWDNRLTFEQAKERQIEHAEKYNYADKIQYQVSYDLLIDEVWQNGERSKKRWSAQDAEKAIVETVAAAKYLSNNRGAYPLVLSAQGVDARQYSDCVEQILPLMDLSQDVLGLGGWCIIGKMPKIMMPVFRETIRQVIPFAAKSGVKRVHIFGVIFPHALGELLWMCNQHEIELSTDSASPSTHPIWGQWGYGNWRDNKYKRKPVETRGLDRAEHVKKTRDWLNELHATTYHKAPKTTAKQLWLF